MDKINKELKKYNSPGLLRISGRSSFILNNTFIFDRVFEPIVNIGSNCTSEIITSVRNV